MNSRYGNQSVGLPLLGADMSARNVETEDLMGINSILLIVGAALVIVALVGLLVFLRRRDAAKGQDKQREGELVQELAAIAANGDAQAAVAAAPTPEAAAVVAAAASSTPPPPPIGVAPVSLTEPPAPEAIPAPDSFDVPVPDATAPLASEAPDTATETAPEATPSDPAASVAEFAGVAVATKMIAAQEPAAPVVEETPVVEPPSVPEADIAPVPEADIAPEPPPAPEPVAAPVAATPFVPDNETNQAAAVVAERLRKLADEVESEARTSSDGFRVFDVVLDGFANLPVGTLLPPDEAVAASSAFTAPSAVVTQLHAPAH